MKKMRYPLRTILSSICLSMMIAACGGKSNEGGLQENFTTAIGVNGYLWRASLDTLAFLPMAQVDVGGGVIISDWYLNPDIPGERIKVSVFLSDPALRADALQVNVHRQVMSGSNWVAAETRAGTVLQLEDAILNRARELRIRSLDDE